MSKKDVILICPDTAEPLDRVMPSLGLLAVAAPLIKEYNVTIIDARVDRDYEKRALSLSRNALAVGFTSMTGPQIKSARILSGKIKEKYPHLPLVWGGWHPSILPEQTASDPCVDIVVSGQGEITFHELLKRLEANNPLDDVKGITFKKNGKIISNPPGEIHDLNDFPYLPFHLVDLKKYPGRRRTPEDVCIPFRATQGCPWRCAYCADPLVFKRKWKGMNAHRIVSEIEDLINRYQVNDIRFIDDTFVVNEKYIREFCEEVLRRELKFEWVACARIGTIAKMSRETLGLIKRSGCMLLHPGVEVATQDMLDMINKDERIEDLYVCAEKLAVAGISALYSFMVAFPGESKGSISDTFKIIKRLKEINPNNVCPVNFYMPFPGNDLYPKCIEHGFKPPQKLSDWEDFNTRYGNNTPWVTSRQKFEVLRKDRYYFPAAFPSDTLSEKMRSKSIWRFVYRAFHRIARYRVDNDWYGFAVDWWLLFGYWKFWQYFNRKLRLHNIVFR